MSDLKSAKDALLAELKHARQGLDHYQIRIQKLEQALASLEALDDSGAQGSKGKRGRKPQKNASTSKRGRPAKKSSATLPSTGREFWAGLVTKEPQSSQEILQAAVTSLGIRPSEAELKKLAQRQANALHLLVKAKAISDSGSGRQRRYLR